MSGIGANLGNSEILNIERIKKENVPQTVENMKKSAEVDGNNNVILVKQDGNDAIVANVKLDSSLNLSSVALEKEGKLGNFAGEIKFFDNGSDDKQLLERKVVESTTSKPVQEASEKPKTEEAKASDEKSLYTLSMDQSYKFVSALSSLGWKYSEDIKKELTDCQKEMTTREKIETIKNFQGGENPDGKWGVSTFLKAKEKYCDSFDKYTSPTDKEFKKIVDDFIKFYDGGISLKALSDKYQLNRKE